MRLILKLVRLITVSIVIVLVLLLRDSLLPKRWKYNKEITVGNQVAKGFAEFYSLNGYLPNDSATIKSIIIESIDDPNWVYEPFYPGYSVMTEEHFLLTFVLDFDSSYLQYDSSNKSWVLNGHKFILESQSK